MTCAKFLSASGSFMAASLYRMFWMSQINRKVLFGAYCTNAAQVPTRGVGFASLPEPNVVSPRHLKDRCFSSESASKMPEFHHPWPEWILFLEDLFQKKYFRQAALSVNEGDSSLNLLKCAVMDFGRDRDDIMRFLPKKDLREVANFGCPGLDRKAINSSKRLRAFLGIPEGDVCQQCKLKNSCIRAFTLPESNVSAKTLDVVRVVLSYAELSIPDTESQFSCPKQLKRSVCNLLEKFVALNATPRDPKLPKPKVIEAVPKPKPKVQLKKVPETEKTVPDNYDWTCPNCDYKNFARNKECKKCSTDRPLVEILPGDWECPNSDCMYMNFARNSRCRECGAFRPWRSVDLRPGDWKCPNPKCAYVNFARNPMCIECETERPHQLRGAVHRGSDSSERFQDGHDLGWECADKPSRSSRSGLRDVNHPASRQHRSQQEVFDSRDRFQDGNSLGWECADKPSRSSRSGLRDVNRPGSRLRHSQQEAFDYNDGNGAQRSKHKEWKPEFRRETSRHNYLEDEFEDMKGDDSSDIDLLEKDDIYSDSDLSDNADGAPHMSLSKKPTEKRPKKLRWR